MLMFAWHAKGRWFNSSWTHKALWGCVRKGIWGKTQNKHVELPAVVTTCDKGADKSHFLYHNNTDCGSTFLTFSTIVEVEGGILFKLKFFLLFTVTEVTTSELCSKWKPLICGFNENETVAQPGLCTNTSCVFKEQLTKQYFSYLFT